MFHIARHDLTPPAQQQANKNLRTHESEPESNNTHWMTVHTIMQRHFSKPNPKHCLRIPQINSGADENGPEPDIADIAATPPVASNSEDTTDLPKFGPSLPNVYIKYIYPDSSGRPAEIISLDESTPDVPVTMPFTNPTVDDDNETPWAPFSSEADFTFAEAMINSQLSQKDITAILDMLHGSWCPNGSAVSFRTYADMERALKAAQTYVPKFKQDSVTVEYRGVSYTHAFHYRDPWRWIVSLVKDPVLAKTHIWHAARQYYCEAGKEDQLIDETNTGSGWWNIESQLRAGHVLLPIHIWLDKCQLSPRVRLHPIVLRPLWQPAAIRNASGNGGSVILGWMPIVKNPLDPDNLNPDDSGEFAHYRREVYHSVLKQILESTRLHSHVGRLLQCGDGRQRCTHPLILIESLDGEEASFFCATYSASGNHPCPKCLIHHDNLSCLESSAAPRTVEKMMAVVQNTAAGRVRFKNHGIHPIEHFLWNHAHSDPYASVGFDLLHRIDSGIWGKHILITLKDYLERQGVLRPVNNHLNSIPIWRFLSHFDGVNRSISRISEFSDGNTYRDLLKVIVPAIVEELPRNSSLVLCISHLQAARLILGLHCTSTAQLRHLRTVILPAYQAACERVTRDTGKSFNWPKQHDLLHHAAECVERMGGTHNQTTRVGEGMLQEVKQLYELTNHRNVDAAMAKRDTNAEAIAHIRTKIEATRARREKTATVLDDGDIADHGENETADGPEPAQSHVRLAGSQRKWEFLSDVERRMTAVNPQFSGLTHRVQMHLADTHARDDLMEGNIQAKIFRTVHVKYSSLDNLRTAEDILRCNDNWYNSGPRRDCALLSHEGDAPSVVRIELLLRCQHMLSRDLFDVAIVSHFSRSQWRPKTMFRGCSVFMVRPDITCLAPSAFVRGALMCPAFGGPQHVFYLMDTVDGDMFLRINHLGVGLNLQNIPDPPPLHEIGTVYAERDENMFFET